MVSIFVIEKVNGKVNKKTKEMSVIHTEVYPMSFDTLEQTRVKYQKFLRQQKLVSGKDNVVSYLRIREAQNMGTKMGDLITHDSSEGALYKALENDDNMNAPMIWDNGSFVKAEFFALYDYQIDGYKASYADEDPYTVLEQGVERIVELADHDIEPVPKDWSELEILNFYGYAVHAVNEDAYLKILNSDEVGILTGVNGVLQSCPVIFLEDRKWTL